MINPFAYRRYAKLDKDLKPLCKWVNFKEYMQFYSGIDWKGKVVLDIGADIGSSAIFFLMHGAWKVYLVENEPGYVATYKRLKKEGKYGLENTELIPANQLKGIQADVLKMDCEGCELPQYVASFNGQSSYITVQTTNFPLNTKDRAVSLWVYEDNTANRHYLFDYNGTPNLATCFGVDLNIFIPGDFGVDYCGGAVMSTAQLKPNTWYNLVETLSNNDIFNFYVNGVWAGNGTYSGFIGENQMEVGWIGAGYNHINILPGYMANVQVYNTALSANGIKALYLEGIGGAPIDIQSLVGWWPLNGNAQDYSGNNNNGQIIGGVTFTGSWTSGYSAP